MTCRAAAASSPKAVTSSAARPLAAFRPSPASPPSSTRFSVPVRSSSVVADWPASAIRRRTASASRATSWPSTRADPASGASRVARIRTVVVLPAPFGPSSPYTVPGGTARSRPSSARPVRNRLARAITSIASGSGRPALGSVKLIVLSLSILFSYNVVKAKLALTVLSSLRSLPRADHHSRSPSASGSDPTPGRASPRSWAPQPRRCGQVRTRAWTTSPGPPRSAGDRLRPLPVPRGAAGRGRRAGHDRGDGRARRSRARPRYRRPWR